MKVGTDGVLLGAWASCEKCRHGLDIGTGTGLLTLMLAQKCPEILITAIEPNLNAFNEASANIQRSEWADRITCLNETFQGHSTQVSYDLIISNPPFYETATSMEGEGRMQARQSIHLPAEHLLSGVNKWLTKEGKFFVIWPEETVRRLILKAAEHQLYVRKQLLIRPKKNKPINRRIIEFRRTRGDVIQDTLRLRDGKEMTAAYRTLTYEYYLDKA